MADTLYEYDPLGNLVRQGLDVDGSGGLEPASTDRITDTETYFEQHDGSWWQETRQSVYAADNNATATTTGTQRTRLSGLGSDGLIAETVTVDIHGNQTVSRIQLDLAAKTETRSIDAPDSAIDSRTIIINGLVTDERSQSGVEMTYSYDALGRRIAATDPRTGTAVTHYDALGQVDYVEDAAGSRTTMAYDAHTGRKIAQTDALGKVTRYRYDDRGRLTHTWGDAAYPVKYDYDAYGQMIRMHTYRSGDNWSAAAWPEGLTGMADTTTWHYQEATGLLTAKEDAQGRQVGYAYTEGGKLETRTWARTDGQEPVTTSYHYDPQTAELTAIDYSDDTADITFTYDRLGRQNTITDAVGTRSFAYNDALQLASETITGLYEKTITRTYATEGVVGRYTGFTLGSGYAVAYGYDASGRFGTLAWNANGQTGTATYGYVPTSDLIGSLSTATGLLITYTYESQRNLKTSIENAYNTQLISQYDYEYDELGRRTSVVNSGRAFADSAFNVFDYDDRSQLIGSERFLGDDVGDFSRPVDPETRLYSYDPIGNRISAEEGFDTKAYTTNSLNQYESIDDGGGSASLTYDLDGNLIEHDGRNYNYNAENRLITVEPVVPADDDFKLEFAYDYMGRRVQKLVYTYRAGQWNLDKEVLFVYDGWSVIEEITTENQTDTSKFYVWGLDLSQTLQGAGGIGGLLAAVEGSLTQYFYYDANGNVGQLVNASDGSISALYEYEPYGNTIVASGPEAGNNPYRFSTKYFDSETELYYFGYRYYSTVLGRWLNRDPINEQGASNVFGFSGQYYDAETGLHYNWHRYYDPKTGRYLTPDPIGLEGGLNLYLYALANPINLLDPFGLFTQEDIDYLTENNPYIEDPWAPDDAWYYDNPWNPPRDWGLDPWHPVEYPPVFDLVRDPTYEECMYKCAADVLGLEVGTQIGTQAATIIAGELGWAVGSKVIPIVGWGLTAVSGVQIYMCDKECSNQDCGNRIAQ